LTTPYYQDPASALGHVFLLQADTALPYPLWNTIEFVAATEGAGKFAYITKGVYGGFAACYETTPFYEKMHTYADKEKRSLLIYPLKISDAQFAKFNDTLNAWSEKEDSYKFFTNNCVNGIYRLLCCVLDSIPEAPAVMTPQNIIRLLNESGKIERPLPLHSPGNGRGEYGFAPRGDMQIPHRYGRFDIGMLFIEKPYANLRFRLLLHDFSDYSGYYSDFITLEALSVNLYVHSHKFNLRELYFLRVRSEIPSYKYVHGWSWQFETGIADGVGVTDAGFGKSRLISDGYLLGVLLRGTMLWEEQMDYYAGARLFFRGFSARNYRFGAHCDYLRRLAANRSVRAGIWLWGSYDLAESLNLFAESALKSYDKNGFSVMLRFYL
jgi:hypothetical protein